MPEFEDIQALEPGMDEMDRTAGGASRRAPLKARAGFILYKVKAGVPLSPIAGRHHCTVSGLMRRNPNITNKSRICVHECLCIRA